MADVRNDNDAQLDIQSNTPELVSGLMATDWIRNPLEFGRAALYLWALSRIINSGEHLARANDRSSLEHRA